MIKQSIVVCKIRGTDRLVVSVEIVSPQGGARKIDGGRRSHDLICEGLAKEWGRTGRVDFSSVPSDIALMDWSVEIDDAAVQSVKGVPCLKKLKNFSVMHSAINEIEFGVAWGKTINTLYIDWVDADLDLSDWRPKRVLDFVSLERCRIRGLKSLSGRGIRFLQVDQFALADLVEETQLLGCPLVDQLSLVRESPIFDCKSNLQRLAPKVVITFSDQVETVEDAIAFWRKLRRPAWTIVFPSLDSNGIEESDIPIKYRNRIRPCF